MNMRSDNNAHAYMHPLTWICSAANLYVTAVNVKEAS